MTTLHLSAKPRLGNKLIMGLNGASLCLACKVVICPMGVELRMPSGGKHMQEELRKTMVGRIEV